MAALVLALVGSGCQGGGTANPASGVDQDGPATTVVGAVVEPEVPNEASAAVLRRHRRYRRVEPLGDLQEQFGVAPTMVEPGTFTTAVLGTSVTLTTDVWFRLDLVGPGRFDLVAPEAALEAVSPRISFVRPIGWYGDRWLRIGSFVPVGAAPDYPAEDVERWATEHDALEIVGRGQTDNGATWLDVRPVEPSPGTSRFCATSAAEGCVPLTLGGMDLTVLPRGHQVRIYRLGGGESPVFALGFVQEGSEPARFDDLVGAVMVGDSGPMPVDPALLALSREAPATRSTRALAAIPGLTFDVMDVGNTLLQRPGELSSDHTSPQPVASISRPVSTGVGDSIETVDDVWAALVDPQWGLTVAEVGTVDVLGVEARSFEVSGGPSNALLLAPLEPGDDPRWTAWLQTPVASVWLVPSPLGPLMLSTAGGTFGEARNADSIRASFADALGFTCTEADSCGPAR